MPSTDRKLELKANTSVAQTGSQPFVYAKGLTLSWPFNRTSGKVTISESHRKSKFNIKNMYIT
jgi:hypothetical protein